MELYNILFFISISIFYCTALYVLFLFIRILYFCKAWSNDKH